MLWIGGAGLKDAVGPRHPAVDGGGFVTRESNMEAERLGWGPYFNDVWDLSSAALSLITVINATYVPVLLCAFWIPLSSQYRRCIS